VLGEAALGHPDIRVAPVAARHAGRRLVGAPTPAPVRLRVTPRTGLQVPRFRNPAAEPDSSPGKQSELKLNVGIGIIGTILSLFSTVIFFLVIEEPILGAVFAVVTVGAAVLTARFYGRLKKGRAAAST